MRNNILKSILVLWTIVGVSSVTVFAKTDVEKSKVQNVTSKTTIQNWCNNDLDGYINYVVDLNQGGAHCYNMCVKHSEINPYEYGFKDVYFK